MERSVILISVPSKRRRPDRSFGDDCTKIAGIVGSFGGRTEGIWAFAGGPFQFVSAATYPDRESARSARAGIEALGMTVVEGYSVFDMPESLQAMAA